jgi:nitrite reductase/ring-hydroxylating ferredoxin subunit
LQNEGFVKVAKKSDIPLSHMKEFQVYGQSVCVANIDGKYFAINNVCIKLPIYSSFTYRAD